MKYLFLAIILSGFTDLVATPSFVAPDSIKGSGFIAHEKRIDSLTRALDRADDRTRFDIEFRLFGSYIDHDLARAAEHLNQCKLLANQHGDSLWIVKMLHANGHLLQREGNLLASIGSYEKALGIARRNNFQDRIKYLLNSLTQALTSNHQVDKALRYSLESLRIRVEEGDPSEISTALLNIGFIYDRMGVHEDALSAYKRSYELKIKNKIDYDLEKLVINICGVLNELGKYEEAETKARSILESCELKGNCSNGTLQQINLSLGISLVGLKRNSEGYLCLLKAYELGHKNRNSDLMATTFYWLARIKFDENKMNEAKLLLDSGELISSKAGYNLLRLVNMNLYAEIYARNRNYQQAYVYQKKENQLRNELYNGSLVKRFSAVEAKHLEHENHETIISQQRELRFQSEAIKQHREIMGAIAIIAFLLIVLVFTLIRINKQKGEINCLLAEGMRERTKDLETSRDKTQHSREELKLVIRNLVSSILASEATLKGLAAVAEIDLPAEHATYFRNAESVIAKMTTYIKAYESQYFQSESEK